MNLRPSKTTPLPNAPVAVIDYETFYRDKKGATDNVSASGMSYWHYTHHPEFYAYLVSIVTSDGIKWVGDPKDAPWESVRGHIWVSHNKQFDYSVHLRLQEDKIVPDWLPVYWGNSVPLCAWLHAPRSLDKAMKALFDETVSKEDRKYMNGRHWKDLTEAKKDDLRAYALKDGECALKIWTSFIHTWPDKERRFADLYDQRCLRGIRADQEGMKKDMDVLKRVIFEASNRIPWRDSEKILSAVAAAKQCRAEGIEPPSTFNKDSEELARWEETYGDTHLFVGAMRDYRRANQLLERYHKMYDRIMPNGRFQISLTYLGTFTGRNSGADKADESRESFNMLNMPRDPLFVRENWTIVHRKKDMKVVTGALKALRKKGKTELPEGIIHIVDVRAKLIPDDGKKFTIADLAQAEARGTNWICQEKEVMDLIRKGFSVYDSHAVIFLGHQPKPDPTTPSGFAELKSEDPQKYALCKARELALGYNSGHVQLIIMAPLYISEEEMEVIFGKPVTPQQIDDYKAYLTATRQTGLLAQFNHGDEKLRTWRINSWMIVTDFRAKKKKTVKMWERLHGEIKASIGTDYSIKLPSGRELKYFNVAVEKAEKSGRIEIMASVEINGPRRAIYGGKALANTVSAMLRDLFMEICLRLDDHDIDVVLDIYDEVLTEVPLNIDRKFIESLINIPPDWGKSFPVGCESEDSMFYKK